MILFFKKVTVCELWIIKLHFSCVLLKEYKLKKRVVEDHIFTC